MVSNKEIRRILSLYAELLRVHQMEEKLAGTLSSAAYYIRRLKQNIITLDRQEIRKLFKPPIAKLVLELQTKSTIESLDELIQLTPAGLFEMMRIKGLGGKKIALIWKKAKIDTLEGLLTACKKNKLSGIRGFGPKTEKSIVNKIESYKESQTHFHYASVSGTAERIVSRLQNEMKSGLISLCGSIRRCALTVPGIDIVAAFSQKQLSPATLKKFMVVKSSSKKQTKGITLDEIPVTIYHSTKKNFFKDQFVLTGNEAHVNKVLKKIQAENDFSSEEDIYNKADMPFIVPEMREDLAEWKFKTDATQLIKLEDIKGVVHNHTTYSDGVDTLHDFVMACKQKGFEYAIISDHSKNAYYARGLKEEKVLKQMKEIDLLNKKNKPFRIFKSIECDIRVNGELDYDSSFLHNFDCVIVSIHQLLKMDEQRATSRLIKAIEDPLTTIVGHMTGRLLLIRSGYPVNYRKIIDACAANGVVIEVNANPYRLDMDWSQIPYALEKGVMISINPDAHSIKEIDNIKWGVAAARKGGLTKAMTWNAQPLDKIIKYLKMGTSLLAKEVV
jgi:DNA polymerase (family 10)